MLLFRRCESIKSCIFNLKKSSDKLHLFSALHRYITMPTSSQLVQCSNTDNFTVVVEGNIGCGKSSFLDYFDKYDDVEIYPEPVEKWMDLNGYNTLNLMYTDPKRWSFAFQSYVQLSMLQHHKAPHTKRVKIIERSIISGKNIFIKNLYQMGNVTVVERDILDEWVKYIMNMDAINVDLIVYLKTDPEVCLNRIKSRCRDEECNISMEYIEALNTLHDDWLITNNGVPLKSRILILDADKDIEEIEKEFEKYKHIILNL